MRRKRSTVMATVSHEEENLAAQRKKWVERHNQSSVSMYSKWKKYRSRTESNEFSHTTNSAVKNVIKHKYGHDQSLHTFHIRHKHGFLGVGGSHLLLKQCAANISDHDILCKLINILVQKKACKHGIGVNLSQECHLLLKPCAANMSDHERLCKLINISVQKKA